MWNYTATDQHGHQIVGVIDDQGRTRRDVIEQFYAHGYEYVAIHDGHTLVAGVDTDADGHRHWWTSLKVASTEQTDSGESIVGDAAVGGRGECAEGMGARRWMTAMTLPYPTTIPQHLIYRLAMPLMRRLPPFAVLHHRDQRTGRSYQTPVRAHRKPDGYIIELTDDHNAPWALNLLTANGGEMTRAGCRYRITNPRRVKHEVRELRPTSAALKIYPARTEEFLQFDATQLQHQ